MQQDDWFMRQINLLGRGHGQPETIQGAVRCYARPGMRYLCLCRMPEYLFDRDGSLIN
jgi:hypothetical protein